VRVRMLAKVMCIADVVIFNHYSPGLSAPELRMVEIAAKLRAAMLKNSLRAVTSKTPLRSTNQNADKAQLINNVAFLYHHWNNNPGAELANTDKLLALLPDKKAPEGFLRFVYVGRNRKDEEPNKLKEELDAALVRVHRQRSMDDIHESLLAVHQAFNNDLTESDLILPNVEATLISLLPCLVKCRSPTCTQWCEGRGGHTTPHYCKRKDGCIVFLPIHNRKNVCASCREENVVTEVQEWARPPNSSRWWWLAPPTWLRFSYRQWQYFCPVRHGVINTTFDKFVVPVTPDKVQTAVMHSFPS